MVRTTGGCKNNTPGPSIINIISCMSVFIKANWKSHLTIFVPKFSDSQARELSHQSFGLVHSLFCLYICASHDVSVPLEPCAKH